MRIAKFERRLALDSSLKSASVKDPDKDEWPDS